MPRTIPPPSLRSPAKPRKSAAVEPAGKDGAYRLEEQIGFLLRRAHQRHVAIFARCMGDLKLTPMQFSALVVIVREGAVTQNLLGRLTAMDPANILGVVQRLSRRGLVKRERDPRDSRATLLSLSPSGRALLQKAIPRARRATEQTLEGIPDRDRPRLIRLLGIISD